MPAFLQGFKGAPTAKSGSAFGHETLTIGLAVVQNPGSTGRNYRIDDHSEIRAILIFLACRYLVDNFRSLGVKFLDQKPTAMVNWNPRNNIQVKKS